MSQREAIVIGGGVNGLAAATYLARAGKRVLVLEARDRFGGSRQATASGESVSASRDLQTLYAFDPRVVSDLNLARHGLRFVSSDMPLVGLRGDGKHIVIQRDLRATVPGIAAFSHHDAAAWPKFRSNLFDLARGLRPLWWDNIAAQPSCATQPGLRDLSRISAMAWLDSWFESDALKAALCFDATAGSLSLLEAGSALALAWRAAQEMSGLQGAMAQVIGNSLITSLLAAARAAGAELWAGAPVSRLIVDGESVSGVRLANGATLLASNVLSSLSRRKTLCELAMQSTLQQPAATAEAKVDLTLRDLPVFGKAAIPRIARFIIADRMETYVAAEMAARAGELANELPMEVIIPTANDPSAASPGQYVVSVLVRPVPQQPVAGWDALKPDLVARVTRCLGQFLPNLAGRIVATDVTTPADFLRRGHDAPYANVERMLADAAARIETPIRGLFLCGSDAEPIPAVSTRAARLAAAMVVPR